MVLIVDDNASFVQDAQVALAPIRAHGLLFADTGKRALDLLQRFRDEIRIAVVDLNLPDISGFDLIREIHKRWPNLAIIGVTAYGSAETVDGVVKMLGADKMISKPVQPEEWADLVDRVRRFREAKD